MHVVVYNRARHALLLGARSTQVRQAIRQPHRFLFHIALLHGDHRDVGEILHLAYHSSRPRLSHIQIGASLQGPANSRAHAASLAQRAHATYVFPRHRRHSFLVFSLLFRDRRLKIRFSLDSRRILVRYNCKYRFFICFQN